MVLTLGDNQYPNGDLADFQAYYAPSWGRFRAAIRPVPGNHDYRTANAEGYVRYFGQAARPEGESFYSFDVGSWHLIALDSNVERGPQSAQERWLKQDLAATRQRCILAYWHHPRFSSGRKHGSDPSQATLWTDLYQAGADIVLNGHEHNYERFGPQNPMGIADPRGGIREFVVGTGGGGLYADFGQPLANSEFRDARSFGVLRLTLSDGSYTWQFVRTDGVVLDAGPSQRCH